MFYHSLVSDWNHGNAHFLRGIVAELLERGHRVQVFEPMQGWSRTNLISDQGSAAITEFARVFPGLRSELYNEDEIRPEEWLSDMDLVLVHEWNAPEVVALLGRWRETHRGARLLFHDTHHRAVSAPDELARFDLNGYDGVLAYGASLQDAYQRLGWGRRVYAWHEAADTRVFYPRQNHPEKKGDVVWIGNWGDDERTEELREYLFRPVQRLGLRAQVFGVRYPERALSELAAAGIRYGGWLPNYEVPEKFADYLMTVHVPRGPYVRRLPGIPTIRPFEALACGIPLVSSPWQDSEALFRAGVDFLMARNGDEMVRCLRDLKSDAGMRNAIAASGLETILSRHTCAHRVDELIEIYNGLIQ